MSTGLTKKETHLIKLDIDGTSTNSDFSTLNQKLKKVLQEVKKQGHKICFTTGRNYLSALPFYKEVGLDTFLVTYNGGFINNPSKDNSKETVYNPIANQTIKEILNEPLIKQNLHNVLIDKTSLTTISTSDDIYYKEIFFNGNPYTKGENILNLLGKEDALQLVLEFSKNDEMFNNILILLKGKYGSSVTFYSGTKLKAKNSGDRVLVPDPTKTIIKIRNRFASKGMGTQWVASYYNISLDHTIAFGNDVNDIELMRTARKGVVTADGDSYLKNYAWRITDSGILNSDGVARFLASYFGIEDNF